jgi:hypothetical protein
MAAGQPCRASGKWPLWLKIRIFFRFFCLAAVEGVKNMGTSTVEMQCERVHCSVRYALA